MPVTLNRLEPSHPDYLATSNLVAGPLGENRSDIQERDFSYWHIAALVLNP